MPVKSRTTAQKHRRRTAGKNTSAIDVLSWAWLTEELLLITVRGNSSQVRTSASLAVPVPGVIIAAMRLPEPRNHLVLARARQNNDHDPESARLKLLSLLRKHLTGYDAEIRHECLQFVAGIDAASSAGPLKQLSLSLHCIREALRERLPQVIISQDEDQGANLDVVVAVDEKTFYLRGWTRDVESPIRQMTAVSPEGERVGLPDTIYRHHRKDIESFYGVGSARECVGFLATIELSRPSDLSRGWLLEMRSESGRALELKGPAAVHDLVAARTQILHDLSFVPQGDDRPVIQHISPAIRKLQDRLSREVSIQRVDDYGTQPKSPDVSIVVPLYKRIDFLEQQLVHFAHDREMNEKVELIYVLDSPEDDDALRERARQLHRLYRLSFRVVVLNRNGGFSPANNLAASIAQGRVLLLMNSDVIPDSPGWLGRMVSFHDSTSNIGALGPKLLYEDDSLQHAGMYFRQHYSGDSWENMHFFKGLHRHLPAANVSRVVPAVTGACLMMNRELYRQVGGLSSSFVQGDYEDSDLCLRLAETGLQNWYLPRVELYHLEGGSYPDEIRKQTTRYNRWLHTRLWRGRMEASEFPNQGGDH